MGDVESYRRKADELLRRAAATPNMAERGKLIDLAMTWHNLAMAAAGVPDRRLNDNDDQGGAEATG